MSAGLILLEPIMILEIVTPEEFVGEIIGDINARRGNITALDQQGALSTIKATAPLSEMFGYSTSLRSQSQGRAAFSMQFHGYEAVPPEKDG
jgi:elongation factor G